MENQEQISTVKTLKTSDAQRAANKRWKDKMKDNAEYKEKQKVWSRNFYLNNKEAYTEYQRIYSLNAYHRKKEARREEQIKLYFPTLS